MLTRFFGAFEHRFGDVPPAEPDAGHPKQVHQEHQPPGQVRQVAHQHHRQNGDDAGEDDDVAVELVLFFPVKEVGQQPHRHGHQQAGTGPDDHPGEHHGVNVVRHGAPQAADGVEHQPDDTDIPHGKTVGDGRKWDGHQHHKQQRKGYDHLNPDGRSVLKILTDGIERRGDPRPYQGRSHGQGEDSSQQLFGMVHRAPPGSRSRFFTVLTYTAKVGTKVSSSMLKWGLCSP